MKCMSKIWIVFFVGLLPACTPEGQQALGVLERDRVSLTATSNEIIQALPIKEGSEVKQGEVLVQFDASKQQAALEKSIADQDKAKAALEKLLNGERIEDVEAARANLNNAQAKRIDAQKSYQRMAQLVKKKLASPSELDNALAERDAAIASVNAYQQTWKKLSSGARQEDIDEAKATLLSAQANVKLQQYYVNELTVIATRSGLLDSLPYNQGERVPVNGVVAIIQTDSVPYARVYVPEPFRARITVGKKLKVHVDGIDETFSGQIRWVSVDPAFTPYNNMSEQNRSRLVYLTEIDLPTSAQRLPAGIPVQVDLESL